MSVICTRTGVAFDVLDPRPEMVNIFDIAHALARVNRFGGHSSVAYSVAQHSVYVSHDVPAPLAKAALLHDAAEAYLGDVMTPVKQLLPDYQALYAQVEHAVELRFGVEFGHPLIKQADLLALGAERRDLMPRVSWWPGQSAGVRLVIPLSAEMAERAFLARWGEVTNA